jgi:uncharacterized repeat protein (TIGR01451 family)
MINQQPSVHPYSPRRRIAALLSAAVIAVLAFSLILPAGAAGQVLAAGGPPPTGGWASAIFKKASKFILVTGDQMTYTIHLEVPNMTTPVIYHADVSDPLPTGLEYVPDSVNESGAYDPATRTISWSQVPVSPGSTIDLTFDVTDTAAVNLPTPTVNTATIKMNGLVLMRQAWVVLMPGSATVPGLLASFKSASPNRLGPGDVVTYTIHLISATAAATADVSDPVPAPLTYVDGSASAGGVYDAATKTISWSGVAVPAGTPVLLTFQALAPAVITNPLPAMVVLNTASITSGAVSFKRSAAVLLSTHPLPPLAGAYKMASRRMVAPGEQFTYTIYLPNSSASPVPATVTDTLPPEVTYVDGSANAGGVYDAATRTLTWSDLSVPDGSAVTLTFDVTAEKTLPAPGPTPRPVGLMITNTAVITSGADMFKRSAQVWLVPTPSGDMTPPVVDSFTIGDTDVLTGPDVTLNIAAHDNVGVTSMYLVEWVLNSTPLPHWQVVKTSGWVPYQATFAWTLSSQSGTHFMGVWVADGALNRSRLTRAAVDFASLVLPGAPVDQGGMVPYLVYYPAGVKVTATLTATTGEAHLFLWNPGNMFAPDQTSAVPGSATQTITFTTQTSGIYMFLVYGKTKAVYDLSITPGGGPRPGASPALVSSIAVPSLSDNVSAPSAPVDGITYNPILPQSGLDPLSIATDPPFFQTFLPVLIH